MTEDASMTVDDLRKAYAVPAPVLQAIADHLGTRPLAEALRLFEACRSCKTVGAHTAESGIHMLPGPAPESDSKEDSE